MCTVALALFLAFAFWLAPINGQIDIVVDDSDERSIIYSPSGSWWHWNSSNGMFAAGANYKNTLSVPLPALSNATVSFNFSGIGFAYYGTTHPDTLSCNLTIDGQYHQLNLKSPDKSHNYGQLIFALQGLPDGQHTVIITQQGDAKGSLFELDRFVYTTNGNLTIPSSTSIPLSTTSNDAEDTSLSGSMGAITPGVIAGGVVSAFGVIVAALVVFWWLRRLDRKSPKSSTDRSTPGTGSSPPSNSSPVSQSLQKLPQLHPLSPPPTCPLSKYLYALTSGQHKPGTSTMSPESLQRVPTLPRVLPAATQSPQKSSTATRTPSFPDNSLFKPPTSDYPMSQIDFPRTASAQPVPSFVSGHPFASANISIARPRPPNKYPW